MRYYTPTRISENIHETPEGYLLCLGVPLTRTGSLVYGADETPLDGDSLGRVTMHRTEDDIFNAAAMASFEGKSVTIDHPEGFVGPDNWKELSVGIVQNVRRGEGVDSDKLLGDLLITDGGAITLVKNGLRNVSCGYEAEYVETGNGEGRQSDIIGNHVALVERGRAGPTCAIQDNEKGKVSLMAKGKVKEFKDKLLAFFDAEMPEETPAEKKPDAESGNASVDARLTKIEEMLAKLVGTEKPEVKPEVKTEDESGDAADVSARLDKIEAILEKLVAAKGEASKTADEETDEVDSKTITGDTAARAEILAPGIAKDSSPKVVKSKALKAFNDTAEGKETIKALFGDKAPNFEDKATVESLFLSASEVVKHKRNALLSATKTLDAMPSLQAGEMTPEKINAINAERYAGTKTK